MVIPPANPPNSELLIPNCDASVFNQIAILAPGLLGASVARAARHFGAAQRIVLWARRPEVRLQLKEQPWCDAVADTPAEAVKGAQLVVICAPVDQIVALARLRLPEFYEEGTQLVGGERLGALQPTLGPHRRNIAHRVRREHVRHDRQV